MPESHKPDGRSTPTSRPPPPTPPLALPTLTSPGLSVTVRVLYKLYFGWNRFAACEDRLRVEGIFGRHCRCQCQCRVSGDTGLAVRLGTSAVRADDTTGGVGVTDWRAGALSQGRLGRPWEETCAI